MKKIIDIFPQVFILDRFKAPETTFFEDNFLCFFEYK
jgi:hypothetical protein